MNAEIREAFITAAERVPHLTMSEWADRFRLLSAETSSSFGAWHTDKTPYMAEIYEHLSPTSPVEEIYVMKGTQLGFTEIAINWLLYTIDRYPAPMIFAMSDEKSIKTMVKEKVNPAIEAMPSIHRIVTDDDPRREKNTLAMKRFPGGFVKFVGAHTSKGLRSSAVKNVFIDELDTMKENVSGEGDAVQLLQRRQTTFPDRKLLAISSPTIKGHSNIEKYFFFGSQAYYHVPCPFCKKKQVLEWKGLQWDEKVKKIRYVCKHCRKEIKEENYKPWMLSNGEWRHKEPGARIKSYHLSSLYSPLGWESWEMMARRWKLAMKAEKNGNYELFKVFQNSALAETWQVRGKNIEHLRIQTRRGGDQYEAVRTAPLPEGIVMLTAGIDVQKDRLECSIVGWGFGLESWQLTHHVVKRIDDMGNVRKDCWQELKNIICAPWLLHGGISTIIESAAIDASFDSIAVLSFVGLFAPNEPRVIPVVGDTAAAGWKSTQQKRFLKINVSQLKDAFYEQLSLPAKGDGLPYCHFPKKLKNVTDYFRQLTAEGKIIEDGKEKWVKNYERNEALDCRIYALAMAYDLNIHQMTRDDTIHYLAALANIRKKSLNSR